MDKRLAEMGSLSRENSASGGGSSVLQASSTEQGELRPVTTFNIDSNILLLDEIVKVREQPAAVYMCILL